MCFIFTMECNLLKTTSRYRLWTQRVYKSFASECRNVADNLHRIVLRRSSEHHPDRLDRFSASTTEGLVIGTDDIRVALGRENGSFCRRVHDQRGN